MNTRSRYHGSWPLQAPAARRVGEVTGHSGAYRQHSSEITGLFKEKALHPETLPCSLWLHPNTHSWQYGRPGHSALGTRKGSITCPQVSFHSDKELFRPWSCTSLPENTTEATFSQKGGGGSPGPTSGLADTCLTGTQMLVQLALDDPTPTS